MPSRGGAGQLRLGALRVRLPAPGPAALLARPRRASRPGVAASPTVTTGSPAAWSASPSRATSPSARTSTSQSISSRADPRSTTTRSSCLPPRASTIRPSTSVTSAPAARSVPACRSASLEPPATTIRRPGRTPCTPASRAAPRASHTPGRSLPGKHAVLVDGARGDDHRLRVRQVEQVGRVDHHERPLVDADRRRLLQHRDPIRGGDLRERARRCARDRGRAATFSPGRPSSQSSTVRPASAAASAADRPATPPPITTTSGCAWRASRFAGGSSCVIVPRPATRRTIGSARGQAQRGRSSVL